MWFDTRFLQSRSTPSSQQAKLNFDESPQWGSSRDRQYKFTNLGVVIPEAIVKLGILIQINCPIKQP